MFIDTHCHLDDPKLLESAEEFAKEYEKERVVKAITMGCNGETSVLCRDLSEKIDSVYFGAGIHPIDAHKISDKDFDIVYNLLDHPKCVAVGEIGLDYYWDKNYKDIQKEVLIRLLEMAEEKKLPVSIHMRDATLDTLTLLREHKSNLKYGGVIHCYAGSKETLKEVLDLGMYVGFGGTVTFKNARNLLEIATLVPSDRILTETDSPFLSPEPFRGKLNTPKNIPIILGKLATLRGEDVEELARKVMNNAKTLFTKL